ncbi:efflux RND transporter permease subunit [candidate division WOR-3 bacterium]|nr:efflux RND transporter permease subunit [candidate division WOR-3 bacterium]
MKLTDTSIKRPVTTILVSLVLVLFGVVGVSRMPVDILPPVTLPMMIVVTSYPGAGPQEVEAEVTKVIEERVGTISNLKEISSRSLENISIVQLQFAWGTNLDAAAADVRDRLDMAVAMLPDAASRPAVFKLDASMMPVLQIALYGDVDQLLMRDVAEDLADGLQRVPGVATAMVAGGTKRQLQVKVKEEKLLAAGITIDALNLTLQAQNLNYPVGRVTSQGKEFLIRLLGEYTDLDQVRNTVVGMKGQSPILLKDIADVDWGPEEVLTVARYNQGSAIFVVVQRRPDANPVQVARAARAELKELSSILPAGVEHEVIFDSSKEITRSISNVVYNILLGGILAVFILFLFLRRFRATLFVAFAIPLSVFFALFFMFLLGYSVNILSMAGLAIAVGMVVDNGIVVFEAIFRHRERGTERFRAASVGADEVAMAITASTLTTIVVFLPLLLVRGFLQVIFPQLVWAVVGALVASLVIALTLIPTLTSRYLPDPKPAISGIRKWSERFYQRIEDGYARLIGWALGHKRLVVFGAVVILGVSLGLVRFIGTEFFPVQESQFHRLQVEMPVGTNLAVTDSAVRKLENYVQERWQDEIEGVAVQLGTGTGFVAIMGGSSGSHSGLLNIVLKPKRLRKHSVEEIDQDIRRFAATIPGLKVYVQEFSFTSMAGTSSGVELDITGYDLATADSLTRKVIAAIETIPGLVDIKSSRQPGKPELQLVVDRQKAALYGLTPYQIGAALRTEVEGNAPTVYRLGGKEYDILIRLPEEQRDELVEILGTFVPSPTGPVPLGNLVTVRTSTGPLEIERKNNERIVKITARNVGISAGQAAQKIARAIKDIPIPTGFTLKLSGSYEEMTRTFRDFALVILIALVLVFVVMASQFESLRDPFIIMFTMPFALIGVLWILFLTRTTLSVISLLGLLILVGVVVNNGIVYIDYTNRLRRERGMGLIDAVKEAGRIRLRPILMTSLTTIFGMLPLAFQIGEGSELWSPLGRAIVGGMIVSTFLPLVFIPVLYTIFETRSERRKRQQG